MVRINPGPVKLSFFVYLISHVFAQGNYILLILYSCGPQVNTIFLDLSLGYWYMNMTQDILWLLSFSQVHCSHRHKQYIMGKKETRKSVCITFIHILFALAEYFLRELLCFSSAPTALTLTLMFKYLWMYKQNNKSQGKKTRSVYWHCLSKLLSSVLSFLGNAACQCFPKIVTDDCCQTSFSRLGKIMVIDKQKLQHSTLMRWFFFFNKLHISHYLWKP